MTEDSRKHMLTFKSESVIRHHILQFTTDFAIRSSAQRNHAVLCTQQQIQTFFFCKELLDIPGGITRCRAKLFRGAIEVLMCWSSKFILDIDLSNEATKLTKATTSAWPASTKTSAHISAAWDHITATQSSQVQKCCKAIFHQCSSYFHMFPKIYRIAHRFPRFLLFVFLAFQTRFEVVLASKKKNRTPFWNSLTSSSSGGSKTWYFGEECWTPKSCWMEPSPSSRSRFRSRFQRISHPRLMALILCVSLRLNLVSGVNQAAFESLNRWKCGFYGCLKMGYTFYSVVYNLPKWLFSTFGEKQNTSSMASQAWPSHLKYPWDWNL